MAARSTVVVFNNITNLTLTLTGTTLPHGEWTTQPPQTIAAGATNVQWESESDGFMTGTEGSATYQLGSSSNTITINWDNPYVGSNSAGMNVPNTYRYAQSGGSGDNCTVTFAFYSNVANGASWMHDNLPLIGNRTLRNICITGSHDSGMSVMNGGTAFGFQCNCITQTNSILGQLSMGARYFDIRPVISGGQYYTGHYSEIEEAGVTSWQGANGQSISDIINNINTFTSQNQELVILNLSHSLNTDLGNASYAAFTQDEWNALLTQLQGINNLYMLPQNPQPDLTQFTLNAFIQNSPAVVIIMGDTLSGGIPVDLTNYLGKGFFPNASFDPYNNYANMNSVNDMFNDQLTKMKNNAGSYFLFSYTLTQSSYQAAACGLLPGINSILDLANEANPQLGALLLPAVMSLSQYPNIIYTDNVTSEDQAAVAMTINQNLVNGLINAAVPEAEAAL